MKILIPLVLGIAPVAQGFALASTFLAQRKLGANLSKHHHLELYDAPQGIGDLPVSKLLEGELSLKFTRSAETDDSEMKFAWQKEPPKKSLELVGQAHTAQPWFLNIVEVLHWTLFPLTFASSVAIIIYFDVWFNMFDADPLRVALWCTAPIIQWCAGLAVIVAHLYEDWQITPTIVLAESNTRTMINESGDKDILSLSDANDPGLYSNERLRQIVLSVLLSGLGVSSVMSFHAYQGWSDSVWGPVSLLASLGILTYSCLGNKTNLVSKHIHSIATPMRVSNIVWLVYSQVMVAIFAYYPLSCQVDDFALKIAVLLPQFVTGFGGIVEGLFAETKFDQRYHLLAVILLDAGACLQCWSLLEIGKYLS